MTVPPARPLVAVCGLGSIGTQHLQALAGRPDVRLIAADPTAALRERAAGIARLEHCGADLDELLERRPDALVIATPDHLHLDQLERAVAQRIPVLVEKPLAASVDDAERRVPALRSAASPVLVGYVLRHNLALQRARQLLLAGVVGEPVSVQVMLGAYGTITAAASRFARPEANRLYRDYSHEWDYLRWLFGPIVRCLAVERTIEGVPHVERPNAVDGLLGFTSGLVGAFHLDYLEPCGVRTVHIVGTGGSLRLDVAGGTISVRSAGQDQPEQHAVGEPPSAALARQIEHLLAIVDGNEQPAVTLDDGLAALHVADALIRSAATGGWTAVATPS